MFITPAYAQAAPAAGGGDFLGQFGMLLPLVAMFVIFYFLLIRPQQKRVKDHQALLKSIRRGDTIVTTGGFIGKVAKVDDTELQVDLAEGVRVRVVRGMVSEVRAKGEPVKDEG